MAQHNQDYLGGDAGNDSLIGGNGIDTLIGGVDNDTLTGGASADRFNFFSSYEGIDSITDFQRLQGDKIVVSASGFGGGLTIGTLSSAQFTIDSTATDTGNRFIYNQATGALLFDADGTSAITSLQFAQLSPSLTLTSNGAPRKIN